MKRMAGRSVQRGYRLVALMVVSLVAVACSTVHPVLTVNLDHPQSTVPGRVDPGQSESVVRVALASVLSPEDTAVTYKGFGEYLQRRLGRPVDVVQQRTYAATNNLIEFGGAQLGLVCSLPYVLGHDQFGLELLAAPDTGDGPVYYSYLVVPAASHARSLADLRGGVFAFADPLSNTGHLVPIYEISKLGQDPQTFFRRTFFTYGHDNSVRAVADGLADGAAVDSMAYDSVVASNPGLRRRIRVIARWGPFAAPPMVVSPSVAPALKARLRAILLSMTDNPDGRQILRQLGVKRFVTIANSAYDPIRAMWRAVNSKM